MADPITLTVIGTAITAGTSLFQGIQGMNQARYQAKVAEINQEIAQNNAKRAQDRAQLEAQEQDALSLALLGEQEAIQGASGFSSGSESFRLTRKAGRELARKDALNIRHAGGLEAHGFNTQAMNFEAEAASQRASATNSLVGGVLGAGASLVGGASKISQLRANRITTLPRARGLTSFRTGSLVR